jgi:hypothetical protein
VDDAGGRCAFVRPDGQRCRGRPGAGRPFCFAHDPQSREARAAACRAGGKRRSQKAVTLDPDGPDAELATMATAISKSDFEVRLTRIEEQLAQGKVGA